jgi:energy-coupling factor transport system ATP-binding protein
VEALRFEHVTYAFPGAARPALDDVTLSIEPGELVLVVGRSGSGKSTLLRAASGLVPHFHGGSFAGRVLAAGLDTREHPPGELAARVGTLFQDPETQVVMGTVRAELAFALENQGAAPAASARAVEETALALAIDGLLGRSTAELSGGELQRVALGATLAAGPRLVVLDEPTSQLDPVAGDELISLLRRLNEDFDTTIVLAEHRLERCLPAVDRVLAMDRGRIVCDATPERYLAWALAHEPELCPAGGRLLAAAGLAPVPGVKRARAALRQAGLEACSSPPDSERDDAPHDRGDARDAGGLRRRWAARGGAGGRDEPAALTLEHVWYEIRDGPTVLRDVSLTVAPGERVALMGRNGAGKSTLLRHAAGLERPTRGRITAAGRVALLLQNPGDYLVHERAGEEASAAALRRVGLDPTELGDRHPRDLSGGERQRLALAIVLDHAADPPAVVLLDEPTRGIDHRLRDELVALLAGLGAAVIVATHDPEFVAAFAERVILLGDGTPIADGPARQILAGGSYFATETARILGGAGGALTPEQGAELLRVAAQPAEALP